MEAPTRTLVVVTATVLAALCWGAPVEAQRGRQRVNTNEIREHLASGDAARIQQAIETIGVSGSPQFIAPLGERVRQGLPPQLLDMALDTLGILSRPEAGPTLFELSTHRRAAVRRRAVEGIVSCRPRGADSALVTALSDSDPQVRATAALGLGQLGASGSINSLFLALDRGVAEASTAIGQVARPEDVARLLEYVGNMPLDTLTPALMELLARTNIPDAKKLEIISRLSEMATAEVKQFLRDFVDSLPERRRGRGAVRTAAEEAILRIAAD